MYPIGLGWTAVSLMLGNLVYQMLSGHHNWGQAVDRSGFQAAALFVVWLQPRIGPVYRQLDRWLRRGHNGDVPR